MEWVPIIFLIFKGTVLFTGMFFAIKWHYDQDRKKKREADGSQSPNETRLFATMIIATAFSLIGVVYAGCWGHASEGGYGGALGCAFTVFMLLVSKAAWPDHLGQGELPAEAEPATLGESLEQLAQLRHQVEQWRAALMVRQASLEREKIYLCIAGLVSTLAWKFGDSAAALFTF